MAFVYLIAMSVTICGIFNNECQNFYLAASVMLSDEMEFFSPKISADQLLCTLEGRQQWCMLAKNKSKEKRLLFLTAMDHPTQHVHS